MAPRLADTRALPASLTGISSMRMAGGSSGWRLWMWTSSVWWRMKGAIVPWHAAASKAADPA